MIPRVGAAQFYGKGSTIDIGGAKTNWGAADTGFTIPIVIVQVLFCIKITSS